MTDNKCGIHKMLLQRCVKKLAAAVFCGNYYIGIASNTI